jgi:hypothetical protein
MPAIGTIKNGPFPDYLRMLQEVFEMAILKHFFLSCARYLLKVGLFNGLTFFFFLLVLHFRRFSTPEMSDRFMII